VAAWGAAQNFIAPRIVLVGGSVGGSGVLLAAARVPALRGLVTLGAAGAPAFGGDAADRIRKTMESLRVPAFLASSEGDAFAGADNVRAWSTGLDHVTARLVPGAAHAMGIYYDVRTDLLAFVRGKVLKD
jgi:pimeloyl-ACP methyl ester carboxylesterase